MEGDIAHQPLFVPKNWNDYPFMWYQNVDSMFFRFVTKHACDGRTDRQTDRITIPKTALAYMLLAVKIYDTANVMTFHFFRIKNSDRFLTKQQVSDNFLKSSD